MDRAEKELAIAEIMHMFRFTYRDEWAPGHIFDGKNRTWVAAFNDLVKQGFIERKKSDNGYNYRWVPRFPDGM